MEEVLLIDELEQANELLRPARIEILQEMAEPISCTALGERLHQQPQRVHYHVKALEQAGLVEKVDERRVRALTEAIYQARARSYWLSPRLVSRLGGEAASTEATTLRYLLDLASDIHDDVARLGPADTPALALSAQIELADQSRRAEFAHEVQATFEALATKYGATGRRRRRSSAYRIALACYPSQGGSNK